MGSEYDPLEDAMWDEGYQPNAEDREEELAADPGASDDLGETGEHPKDHKGDDKGDQEGEPAHHGRGRQADPERRQRRRQRHRDLHQVVRMRPMPPGMRRRFGDAVSVTVTRGDGTQIIFVRTEGD